MVIALIIYLTGVVLFWILNPVLIVKKYGILDMSDVVLTVFGSVTSWIMYIDGISKDAYKSSYDLTKPYHLGYEGEFGKDWIYPLEAFKRIREDNGLETF